MLKFLLLFIALILLMAFGFPVIGIGELPLWQLAAGAFIPASAIAYLIN
jgi:hypothetical protein